MRRKQEQHSDTESPQLASQSEHNERQVMQDPNWDELMRQGDDDLQADNQEPDYDYWPGQEDVDN